MCWLSRRFSAISIALLSVSSLFHCSFTSDLTRYCPRACPLQDVAAQLSLRNRRRSSVTPLAVATPNIYVRSFSHLCLGFPHLQLSAIRLQSERNSQNVTYLTRVWGMLFSHSTRNQVDFMLTANGEPCVFLNSDTRVKHISTVWIFCPVSDMSRQRLRIGYTPNSLWLTHEW